MKRKAPTPPKDGNDASRAQRKRVQNRISQKCHRERQAAHARHLESVVDIIKAGDQDGDDASDRYTALLRQHMKIIEEKRELQEALFRMRKKLLSISNSAAAAADDEAVDALVRSRNPTKGQLDSPSPSLPTELIEPSNEDSTVNVEAQPQKEDLPPQNATTDPSAAALSPQEPQQLYLVDDPNISTSEKDSGLPTMNWSSDPELPNSLFGTGPEQLRLHDHSSAWSFGPLELTFPLDYRLSISQPTTTITVTSSTVLVETILHACRKYISMHASESENDPKLGHDLATCDWSQEAHVMNNIAQISGIAVNMLAEFAGLETYVYGVGGASVMESILRWQLMPTYASRASIPEPFRPTPLQYSSNDYPLVVDFVNWPSIRDQLILQSRTINIDETVRELVQNTVVDIPHHHMSVNVFSLFYICTLNPSNQVAWNSNPKTSITDAQWKYLEILAPSEPDLVSPNPDVTPAESVLVQEISRRMDTGSNILSPRGNNQQTTVETNSSACSNSHPTMTAKLTGSWNPATQRRNEIIFRLGLDQVSKWKLSKDFARNHPFLDCSSAIAAYDMVSAQRFLEAEARAY